MAVWQKWDRGFRERDLRQAEERFGLRFPPDLFDFLQERRFPQGYDWADDWAAIEVALGRPLEGILFDVEHNDIWWQEWGDRPTTETERADVVTAVINAAPKLVPLFSHRYLPAEPHARGNPVISVMQMDIIYYGSDLLNYIENEFGPSGVKLGELRHTIPFWSTAVERAYGAEATWMNGS